MARKTSTALLSAIVIITFIVGFSVGYLLAPAPESGNAAAEGIPVVDDYGRVVTVPQPLERIVSIAPSNTEILFSLGLGDRVVGVDNASDYPSEALSKTRVGGYFGGYNLEVIAALDPQLILASSINSDELIGDLENRSHNVVVLDAKNITGVFHDILLVGTITNTQWRAEQLILDLNERVLNVTRLTTNVSLERPSVYVEIDSFLYTYGPGSFGDELLRLAGGENIAGDMDSPYPSLDEEFIVSSAPEVIITVFTPVEDIKSRPGWSDIPAVQNDRVLMIDGSLVSRPGPRIVDGLEGMAHLIHPEIFP